MVKQLKKRGRGRPATGRRPSMTITLPETTLRKLKTVAKRGDTTCSSVIVQLIESSTNGENTR